MDTDENAPPSNDEKTAPAGMLSSPFGFFAGVRAMLSPPVKDQISDAPIVTGRAALRDVNAAASPNQKIHMTGAQQGLGGGGQVPAETAGDALLSPDKSSWQERGDRTSVASENSFVSALSSGNTSIPDSLHVASPSRFYTLESDTDTSTAYESAGETEGNNSVFEEVFKSSEGVLSNQPIAVSSPLEAHQLNETFEKGAKTTLNETVQLEDSAEGVRDPLSVSFLVDHLGSLSLSTPLKLKDSTSSPRGHVTLASDVSGDLDCSSDQDSICVPNSDAKESLDTTITLTEGDEKEIEEIPQENSCQPKEVDPPKECAKTQDLNRTVDIASDSSSGNLSVVEVEQAAEQVVEQVDADSEISAAALRELEGLSESLNFSSLNQSDLSAIEAKLLEGLDESFHPRRSLNGSSLIQPVQLEANFPGESVLPVPTSTISIQDSSQSESEDIATLNETVVEVATASPSEKVDTSVQEEQDLGSHELNNIPTSHPEVSNSNLPVDNSPTHASSESETSPVAENVITQENANSFEDAPLPVRVPRSFEEILAEQLGAAGQSEDLSSADPNKVCITAASTFDEAPLPTKKQRTFEEILAEELAAQNLNYDPVEPEPQPETDPSDEITESTAAENTPSSELLPENAEAVEEEDFHSDAEVVEEENFHSETAAHSESENPIPIKPPRTFEEILEAELAAQSDPENAVPSFSAEEAPIPIKPPRTFEEILAAELAAQNDPEQAVPSFSIPKAEPASTSKLNESYAKLISSESSSIESESEPVLVSDAHGDLESETNNGLDLLIEKCKLQQQDLELGEPEFKDLADEAGRLSMSCLSESVRASSVESEESLASDLANQTVIRADLETSPESKSPQANGQVQAQSPHGKVSGAVSQSFGNDIDEDQFSSAENVFVDPSGFDFLSQRGGLCSVRDFRKESLYVKFDPLVGSLSDSFSIMHPENSSENQSNQTAPADEGQQASESQSAAEKLVSLSPSSSKQATAPTTPSRGLVKSTPVKTPAHVMLSETLSSIGTQGPAVKQEDLIKKLQEHQSVLEEQDKAYQERIAELEQRLQEMDLQSHQGDKGLQQQLLEKEKQLQEKERQFQEKAQSLVELNVIMKEYEKTISRLVAEKSQEKAAFDDKQVDLVKERDQAQQHLNNMEIAFSDIHTKYERLKSIVEVFKKNEETLNTALSEKQANFDKMQSMYDMLKSHAVSKLEKANQDLEGIRQKHQQENAKLKAMIKKLEVKTKSLEDALEQKVKENQALTAICDELINKVGE